jgi:hypothetical protein
MKAISCIWSTISVAGSHSATVSCKSWSNSQITSYSTAALGGSWSRSGSRSGVIYKKYYVSRSRSGSAILSVSRSRSDSR